MHTCTYMHAYKHTHAHMHIHAHAYKHGCIHTWRHRNMQPSTSTDGLPCHDPCIFVVDSTFLRSSAPSILALKHIPRLLTMTYAPKLCMNTWLIQNNICCWPPIAGVCRPKLHLGLCRKFISQRDDSQRVGFQRPRVMPITCCLVVLSINTSKAKTYDMGLSEIPWSEETKVMIKGSTRDVSLSTR